ncbi:T9SS type A sorting domain-containing protein [Phaeocystidibacter luteus]|uniref:T9SS type A sorting domain-containing protein n=1 Tax=Phaeocystidibacter luteus TaxID=911197 RepID=A0A6N6RFG5_9FLAO|nr:T9SS type A sorting domain-containing protein [Phaeocystidibacter luteus]KAB2806768.1 T9SS type A sorting domain-containing protein [Phaeocystidibacter luteus]
MRTLTFALIFSSFITFAQTPQPTGSCDFNEDFQGDLTSWNMIDSPTPSNPRIAFDSTYSPSKAISFYDAPNYTNDIRIYKPLPIALCSYWKASADVRVTAMGTTDPTKRLSHFLFAFSENNGMLTRDMNLDYVQNDFVGLVVGGGNSSGFATVLVTNVNETAVYYTVGNDGDLVLNETYTCYLERIDSVNYRVTAINARTGDTATDGYVTTTHIVPNNASYIQVGNNPHGWHTRRMSGYVDNICIDNCHGISVPEFKPEFEFAIYPNPTTENLTVELSEARKVEYHITDMSGRILQKGKIRSERFVLNVSTLPVGVYLIRLQSKDGIVGVQRWVKH